MSAESKPSVIIADHSNGESYLQAAKAVAQYAGYKTYAFQCLDTAYEHLSGEGYTHALIASLGLGRASASLRERADQLLEKAQELGIPTAFMSKSSGSPQYALNQRDIYIPTTPRQLMAPTLGIWLRAISEPAYLPSQELTLGQEDTRAAPKSTTLAA